MYTKTYLLILFIYESDVLRVPVNFSKSIVIFALVKF